MTLGQSGSSMSFAKDGFGGEPHLHATCVPWRMVGLSVPQPVQTYMPTFGGCRPRFRFCIESLR
jgi:hypothetical protein